MSGISLCMIARDEAMLLQQCFDSVKDVVCEIIFVDTGSLDETKSIAAQAGAKIFDLKWVDDFSMARNFALDQATGDWVLFLDADETISRRDHGRLLSLVNAHGVDAYTLVQRTYGDDLRHAAYVNRGADPYEDSLPYAGWVPSMLVRLFRNDPAFRFRYRIHELVEPSILERGGVILDSEIPIHHFTYKKNPEFVNEKLKRYLDLGLRQIEDTPEDPKPYLEAALVCLNISDFVTAEQLLQKAIALSPDDANLYDSLGALYLHTNRAADAERVLRKSLSLRADDAAILNKLAGACMARGAYGEADQLLDRALVLAPGRTNIHNNRGLLFAVTNRPYEAIESFQYSLRLNPRQQYALASLGMLYVNLGRYADANPILERALEIKPDDPRTLYHLAVVYARFGQRLRAVELLKRAQLIQPGDPAIAERLREFA